jgi:glycosyltransferase involved in cell wall biosynthesis
MRVVVLSAEPDGPSVRHRWVRMARHFEAAGIGLEVVAIPEDAAERAEAFAEAGEAEVTVLSRRLLRSGDFARLLRSVSRLVYDFDDAMPYRDPWRGPPESSTRAQRFHRTCVAADAVLAGSEYLATLARTCGPRAVFTAPTPVDVAAYGPTPTHAPDEGLLLGWIGSRSTLPYLHTIAGPLARVLALRPGARLLVMADVPPELPGVPVEFVPWSVEGEAPALRRMAVGVMPLTDDPWSRGKCAFKILQYMATGIPTVASPVGANTAAVVEGRTGLLATTGPQWEEAMGRLLDDAALRARLGTAAREIACSRWSTDVLGPPLAAFLRAVGEREPPPEPGPDVHDMDDAP